MNIDYSTAVGKHFVNIAGYISEIPLIFITQSVLSTWMNIFVK